MNICHFEWPTVSSYTQIYIQSSSIKLFTNRKLFITFVVREVIQQILYDFPYMSYIL